jgi:hypothetical protein
MESASNGQEVALWLIDWNYHEFWGVVCLPKGTSVNILPTWYREWQELPEDDRPKYTDWIVEEKGCVERKGVGFCVFESEGPDTEIGGK